VVVVGVMVALFVASAVDGSFRQGLKPTMLGSRTLQGTSMLTVQRKTKKSIQKKCKRWFAAVTTRTINVLVLLTGRLRHAHSGKLPPRQAYTTSR
jgi:hypothetical protein